MNKHHDFMHGRSRRPVVGILPAAAALLTLSMIACGTSHSEVRTPRQHLALHRYGQTKIYIDRVDNRSALDVTRTKGSVEGFRSFLIGRQDSVIASVGGDKKDDREEEEYFQYTMQNDWVALAGGDTLRPVFFQEKKGLDKQIKEGVMVFETSPTATIDTLIYRDSFDGTKPDIFVVNRK